MSDPTAVSGHCHALFSFEVGQSIDLDFADRLLEGGVGPSEPATPALGFGPASRRVAAAPIRIEELGGPATTEVWLYGFGAATVVVSLPFQGLIEGAAPLGWRLRSPAIGLAARERLHQVVGRIAPAISRLHLADLLEDYSVFALSPAGGGPPVDVLERAGAPVIATLLVGGTAPLSSDEIQRAVSARISYRPGEVVIVDWDAAVVLQRDAAEVLSVLEFANVQLLEFRHLDGELDRLALKAYAALAAPERSWLELVRPPRAAESRVLGELQADAALLFERVSNQGKSMTDQYLTRVYRLVAERFRLADWDRSITRKLDTIDGIYQKLSDRANARRMELLEWLVILLIAAEMALGLLRR